MELLGSLIVGAVTALIFWGLVVTVKAVKFGLAFHRLWSGRRKTIAARP